MNNHLIELHLSGQDSFRSSDEWIRRVTGSLFCSHCHNVYETVDCIDAVVSNAPRDTDMDLIAVNCGHVRLFSQQFVRHVGKALVEKTAGLGRLYDIAGFEHSRYYTAISHN